MSSPFFLKFLGRLGLWRCGCFFRNLRLRHPHAVDYNRGSFCGQVVYNARQSGTRIIAKGSTYISRMEHRRSKKRCEWPLWDVLETYA